MAASANATAPGASGIQTASPKVDSKSLRSGDASFMLLGGISFVMGIFYMVNSRHASVVDNTWSMLNTGVSIFCAVLTYGLANDLVNGLFAVPEGGDGAAPGVASLVSAGVQLIAWWYFVVFLLFFVKDSVLRLKAYGTLGGHILGFAALNVYGKLALTEAFRGSPVMTLLDAVIALVTMGLLFMSSRLVRGCLQAADCVGGEDDARWHDQSLDTGNDFFALCIGFLLSMCLRFGITGELPSIDGELGGASAAEVSALALAGAGLFLLGGALALALHRAQAASGEEGVQSRVLAFALAASEDGAAFSWLFAAMWQIGGAVEELMAHTAIALTCSAFAAVFVLLLSIVPSGFLRGSFAAVGLMVGFSWEKAFDCAADGVGDLELFGGADRKLLKALFSLGLLIIVFPAWMVYILPKSDSELKEEARPSGVSAICWDESNSEADDDGTGSDDGGSAAGLSARELVPEASKLRR